jgi:hypothetical protein
MDVVEKDFTDRLQEQFQAAWRAGRVKKTLSMLQAESEGNMSEVVGEVHGSVLKVCNRVCLFKCTEILCGYLFIFSRKFPFFV